jgi:hypothetical protein
MQPGQEELGFVAEIGLKIAGVFLSFVGGIVTATWVVANKLRGYDDRLSTIEAAHKACQNGTLVRIDEKLDKIHERIDEILLRDRHERHNL